MSGRATHVPKLERHCGSWIVTRKTGEVVGEFFNRNLVERFDPQQVIIETAIQYLVRLNKQIAEQRGGQ